MVHSCIATDPSKDGSIEIKLTGSFPAAVAAAWSSAASEAAVALKCSNNNVISYKLYCIP